MKRINFFRLVALIGVLSCVNFAANAQCNCGWTYKTPVTITNLGSTALTDYQVSITLNTQALISAGKMQSTGNDIRFTDASCTNLPYWIESGINTPTTVIWVKVNSIAGSGPTTINLFYGNSSAAAASDGNTTFLVFDDFNGSSVDAAKWSTSSGSGSVAVSGGTATFNTSGGYCFLQSISTYASPYNVEMKVNAVSGNWPNLAQFNSGFSSGAGIFMGGATMYMSNFTGSAYGGNFTYSASVGTGVGIWSVIRTASNVFAVWPGGSITGTTGTLTGPTGNQLISFGGLNGGTSNMVVDWIRGRQYYVSGTTQAVGTETANGSGTLSGTQTVCAGSTTTFSSTASGGVWVSGTPSVATVTGGVVTGVSAGTALISYTIGSCTPATRVVTVNPLPSAITGTNAICVSTNSPLSSSPAGGVWTSTNGSVAGVGGTGIVSGLSTGTTTISYSFSGCAASTVVTVTVFGAAITGTQSVCAGLTTALGNPASGGTWTSSSGSVATINSSGVVSGVSAGTSNITYTSPIGCISAAVATVNPLPVITFSPSSAATICMGNSTTITALASGSTFTWAGMSGAGGLSCTSCATNVITPTSVGMNSYSITATSSFGCISGSTVAVSVNPLPATITGLLNTCVGTVAGLSDASAGGTWGSSNTSIASITPSTGMLSGLSLGAATITYTLPTTCYITAVANVSSAPAPIGGTAVVCTGLTTNLNHGIGGGTWSSSNTAIATVNPSGVVTGNSAGNAVITYTLPSGCMSMIVATVNALPGAISGMNAVCVSSTTPLSSADAGGTWTSSTSNAIVNPLSGVVTGNSAGTTIISYTMANGCYRTQAMTVNAIPALITGTPSVCHNSVTVLSNATPGGTWSSSNPANAFVDASGVVTGIGPNTTVIIDYVLSTGCKRSVTFTVNPLPAVIGGTQSICQGDVTTLTNTDGGGTWATSNGMVATVNASGDVSGVAAGNATITYTLGTGCRRTAQVTVNALPVPISGTAVACVDQTVTLYNFSGGGTWISGNPGIATVNGSGDVTGVSAGQVNITYQLPTGCVRTQIFTVNALPATISGSGAVCVGQGTSLSNTTGGGTWSSSTPGSATIDGSGMVTGVSAGNTVITYALPTGCSTTKILTVNGLPVNITGPSVVCEGSAITLNNGTPGGGWTSESDAIATVSGSGSVSGIMQGTVTITYTLPTTCYRTKQVTVNPLPDMIGGNTQVCVAQTTTLDNATSGGTWSSSSPGIAPVNTLGVVNGLAAGGANITYTLPTGCRRSVAVVVNPLPNAITGSLSVCQNSTTTLNSSSAGGTWESGNVTNATITSGGVVMGMNPGTSQITYTLPTGCRRTANVNVNPLPGNITGSLNVCQDMTSALGNDSPGGAWTSSSPGTASVSSLGVVTGVSTGTANITYTLPTSCRTASTVVVNPLPAAIGGTLNVCESSTTQLTDATVNGMWSSSAPSIADVDGTGIVSGMMAGTATISYTLPTGCYKTASVLVNPRPAAITGEAAICQSSSMTLSSATSGGTWSSSNPSILMVSGAGVATGVAPGVAAVSYTLSTGCARTLTMSVDGIPLPISGPNTVCVGGTAMQSTMSSGGFWSSASSVASVSFLGEVSGNTAGTAVITYLYGSGCYRTKTITVNALPAMISGDNAVCMGSQTTLSNTTSGGTWLSNSTAHATVNNTTGVVTGVSGGMVLMSYVLPTGCQRVKTMSVNATPASIGGLLEICNGGTTTLSSTTPGGVWISGNTATAIVGISGGNVSALSAGVSTISYTLATGCKTTAEVTVHANPAAITGMASVCVGSNSILGSTTPGGIWSSADDATATVSSTGILGGVSAGSTTVTYSLGTGCYTTASVAVNALPVAANVTGSGSYCAGGSGISVGLDASQASTTYKLYRSGNSTPVGSYSGTGTPLFFGSMTTAGMYTVTATNAMGCSSNMIGSASVSITPVVTPMVSVSTGAAGDTVCAGTSVTFDATVVNEGTTPGYVWKVNGTPMSTSGSSYVYTPVNGDIISVTLNSSATCALPATATAVKPMTVLSVETPSANIGVSPSASVCEGTTVTFTAASSNGGDSPVYTWKKNGSIPMGTGTTISFKPSDNDMIMCILHSSYRCASVNNVSSNSIVMNVDKVYIPEVQISVMPGTTVYANQQVTFSTTVTNAGPAPTYQWLKNGVAISGAIQPTYVGMGFKHGDSVTCKVKGSGACGEETINSVMLSVLPSTGVATTTVGTTEVKLVPNPNNGTFSVIGTVGAMNEEVKLQVTDVLGQVVYSNTVKAANGKLNTSVSLGNTLANGMYLLNVISGADRTAIHFVVKQ